MTELPSRLPDIEIPADNPFANDKLDRKKYAETLTAMVRMYAKDGCVLSINGDWGSGKTTFVNMWRGTLEQEGIKFVYFNAWETDYFSDPLTAILGELQVICTDKEKFKNTFSSIAKFVGKTGFAALKILLENKTGLNPEIIKTGADCLESEFEGHLQEYREEKETLCSFKKSLSEYVADEGAYPLVFIVDELDRCNPHYAVKVLETIKHLFDVPNIVFVLALSKSQLECSIKGFYGSDQIDAENYLRRFIDIQFDLPQPSKDDFCDYLFNHYQYSVYFESGRKELNGRTREDSFKSFTKSLFKYFKLDLRSWDKVFSNTRLTAIQLGGGDQVVIELVFILCFLKFANCSLYDQIRSRSISLQDLIDKIELFFPNELMVKGNRYDSHDSYYLFMITICELLYTYDYTLSDGSGPIVSINNETTDLSVGFKKIDPTQVKEDVNYIHRSLNIKKNIHFFTDKVDLCAMFKK